jgi:hypothetical protein
MSIKYIYLEPNSPFSTEALNSRFAAAETGINALNLEDLSVGALHSDHMPSPIGPNGVNPSSQVFSVESSYSTGNGERYDEEDGLADGTWYNPGQTLTGVTGGSWSRACLRGRSTTAHFSGHPSSEYLHQ